VFFLNKLAPQETVFLRGFLVFLYCFKYSVLTLTKCKLDLVLFDGVRWFWGLTCDFWAENAKIKIRARVKVIDSYFAAHSAKDICHSI
jgi:hypothetical protein